MTKNNRLRNIILILLIFLLVCAGSLSSFAASTGTGALPSYSGGGIQSISEKLDKEDVKTLANGMRAQLQLQVPQRNYAEFYFFTMVESTTASGASYLYRVYFSSESYVIDQPYTFYGTDKTKGVVEYGMYVGFPYAASGRFSGIDMSITGGSFYPSRFDIDKDVGDGAVRAYKLADREVVVAVYDKNVDAILTVAPDEYYTIGSYTVGDNLSILQGMRNMANSWVAARDAKISGSAGSSSGGNYQEGYEAGYDDGYDAGYAAGVNQSSTEVFSEAYESGYSAGYDVGQQSGYHTGYAEGYAAGKVAGTGGSFVLDIPSIVSSVPTGVRQFINSAFGFEVFGINIAGLLSVLMLSALVFFIIKFFLKK